MYETVKIGRETHHYQYRINKKGAECFRTGSFEEAKSKLTELNNKRPGIYTMQCRSTRCNKFGMEEQPLEKMPWF